MNVILTKILFSLRIIPVLFLAAAFFLGLRLTLLFTGFEGESPFSHQVLFAEVDGKNEPQDHKSNIDPDAALAALAPPSMAGFVDDEANFSPQKLALLNKLQKRKDEIEQERKLASNKENVLLAVEKKLDDKFIQLDQKKAELEKIRDEILRIQGTIKKADNRKLMSLVKIYETMKPADAARIFEALDLYVLLEVLENMKESKTAPILAKMSAEKAKTVTIFLAQKRPMPKINE